MKKNLLLSTIFLIFSFWAWAQQVQISGVVKSAIDGLPLPGVSITIKGTVTGVLTDINGTYAIKANPNQVLVFSFIGMNPQEVLVTSSNKIVDITLTESATSLQEVVVVGYGTQKRSVVTGAISSVKAKDMEKNPNGRIEQALQGRVSGLTVAANSGQPGSPSTIRVRGVTTFGDGGNNPLWVVDGVVVDNGGIGYLNQGDIASIEVLKDATSAAIYGTRAATGVILVTTKKGQAGKLTVNYNSFFGSSSPAKRLQLLNASQYATLINEKYTAAGLEPLFPNVGDYGIGTDWQDVIFNTSANRYSHELSLSGGNEKSTFYTSVGIQDQQGIVTTNISNYNKVSVRLNSDHKISKVFTFGQTFGYTHAKSIGLGNTNSEFGGPLSSAINLDPITPIVITDPIEANKSPYSNNPVFRDADGNPYGISSYVGQEMSNPMAYEQTRLGQYNWSDDFVGNAYLEANVNNHIKIRSSAGAKIAYWGWQGFTPVYYMNAFPVLTNNYTKNSENTLSWNIENTITYSNKIQDHDFSVLLGQGAYVTGIGGGQSNTLFALPISSWEDASFNFDIPQLSRNSGTWDETLHKISSLFSRVNYSFKEKYLFTGIIRRDGSTRFGANYKYGIFPSFSLGWVVSNEGFWKTNDLVKSLKIRGGYGVVGNDNISEFGYLATIVGGFNYSIGNTGSITTGYAPKTLDNPDLHWEQTSQLNFGFDARFLTNFNIVVDLFKKRTTGILREVPIPAYVGVSSRPVKNLADMDNKGIEVELGYNNSFGEFNFSASGNVAYLKNEVTYVNTDADFIAGDATFQSMNTVTRTQVGQSYNSFYGYETNGIFQNWDEVNSYTNSDGDLIQPVAQPGDFRWVDTDNDGTITADDKTFLGTNIPKYTFGLTVNASYKGFDAMVFAQGSAGNKIFQGLRRLDIPDANYQTVALSRWTGEGTSNTFPRLTNSDLNGNFSNMSDFYLEKGDYVRIKQVQIGYTFDKDLLQIISVTKLRIYLQTENLFTLTKYTGFDPEVGGGVYGIDKGMYPQARSIIGGIQLQF